MRKKIISISVLVLVLVLALFAFTACNTSDIDANTELLSNTNFESWNEDDAVFPNWTATKGSSSGSDYGRQPKSGVEITVGGEDYTDKVGEQYLYITNSSSAYTYVSQSIAIDRNHIYKVSVDIKVSGNITIGSATTFKGAYVTFLENTGYVFGDFKSTTDNGWTTYTFYVRPTNSDYLTIALCLGSESEPSRGTAYFDNVSLMRVEGSSVPADTTVTSFKKAKSVQYNVDTDGVLFTVFMTLFSVAVLATAYVLIRRLYAQPKAFIDFGTTHIPSPNKGGGKGAKGGKKSVAVANSKEWYKNTWFIAAMLALGTFLIRLIFLLSMYGFGSEMNTLVSFARIFGQTGVTNAYATYASTLGSAAPGSLYILTIIGAIGGNLDNAGLSILLRLVNVIADIAVVEMIYFYGRKYVGNKFSTIYAALYALIPFAFIMSGVNGSFESVLVAFILAAIILMVEKQYLFAYLVAVLGIVLDIRFMAIVPIMAVYMGYMYYRDDDNIKKFTKNRAIIVFGLLGAFVLTYLLTLPAAINQIAAGDAFYNFKILANEVINMSFFVKNALNLYGMVAMNGKTTTSTINILNLIFILVLEIFVASLYFKNRNKQEILLLASFTLAVISVFTIKVDFTYMFLSIALGLVYTMISGDKRMYGVMSGYSLLGFVNLAQIMSNSGHVASSASGAIVNFETTSAFYITFSVFAVLLTAYYVYVTYSITNNGKLVDIKAMPKKFIATVKDWFGRVSAMLNIKKADK